ncbi:hypothetical protein EJB05_10380 [Eragrostis curvula]|uniref:PHD-type domain-containing protein n=1 Tax=Eragrostis curvula TaxID=38414 RepID=A0A5J9VLH4_9POAL|nr:hypothetical protein EJB05_10380 [Eragrostis curvula]
MRPSSSSSSVARRERWCTVLMDKNILVPRDKVVYKETARDGTPVKKEGLVSGDGVKCTCCNKAFTVAEFEAHASGELGVDDQHPWGSRVFLRDGTSLAQCLVQLMQRDDTKIAASSQRRKRMKVKSKCADLDGDSVCSICHDGGDLLLCDNCPSTFHHDCLGMHGVPEGDWFCPCCRCGVCDGSDFDHVDATTRFFTDRTIIYCDQCEKEYHVGCVRDRGYPKGQEAGEGPWLCSPGCAKVFHHLQGLVLGRPVPTSIEGVSLVVLRSSTGQTHGDQEEQEEIIKAAERHGKLCAALDVLHECFVTLIEPRTQTDLSDDIVFNRESELRRLDFRGYYVVGLEKAGELVTAATLRVYGNKVAELPLVGTRFAHRRQGMCHLLVRELEHMLGGVLGVERLVLPAVPELLQTWTGSFGFKAMTHSDKLQVAQHTILCFQGTTMCQKLLRPKLD